MTSSVDFQSEMNKYWGIFAGLATLTLVSVAVSYAHLSVPLTIGIILSIAVIKATLVLCHFMHLISTRIFVYSILILTVVLISGLFSLPIQKMGTIRGTVIVH